MTNCCDDFEADGKPKEVKDSSTSPRKARLRLFNNPWMVSSLILLLLLIFTQLSQLTFKGSKILKNSPPRQSSDMEATSVNIDDLREKVVPKEGFALPLTWSDLGPKVVEAGAIDLEKLKELYERSGTPLSDEYLKIFSKGSNENITINFDNSRFIVNFFWALGLAQKSKILDEGPMRAGQTPTENFASTGGWNLGKVKTMDFYSKHQIVRLTTEQEKLVEEITKNVYRPCCGNPTSFPDCNHGMAALGVAEVMASQGFSKREIFDTLLKLNSFWFPDTYIRIAAYFERERVSWRQINPEEVLSKNYSSSMGAQEIAKKVSDIPAFQSAGGSCGA